MKAILPFLCAVLLLDLLPASAANYLGDPPDLPPIVSKGFVEMKKNGTLSAMSVWLDGSSRDNDGDQDQATARMNNIQGRYGRMIGYEIMRIVGLTPSVERVYAAVKFEKGVAWMSFDCYQPDKEWIVSRFDFATNANLILPPNILGGQ